MPPVDAWLVRRILCGKTVETDDLDRISARFRAIVDRLATLPADRRRDAYGAYLDGLDDSDAVARAVDDADPDATAPESTPAEDDSGDHEWGPIRYSTPPAVEHFPLDVLPHPARQLAEAAAKSIGSPVDFIAVGIIAAASIAIGRSCSLMVKPGYFESASVFAAIVGGASSGKSPSLKAAVGPIWAIQDRLRIEREAEVEAWGNEPPEGRRPKPTLPRLATSNPTTEALGPILAANPRGLIVLPDEMTGWVSSMDQYKGGKGGDRSFYLSAWSGEPVYIDRAKNQQEPIAVPHPFLSVVGGMVPSMLPSLAKGGTREDGFTARLLFSYPDRPKRFYSEEGVPGHTREDFATLLERLHARPMQDSGSGPVPQVVQIASSARSLRAGWHDGHHKEVESPDFPPSLDGAWGKLEAYGYRLALILHLLDLASDPTAATNQDLPELPASTIANAFRLVDYFKSHARRVHTAIDGKDTHGGADVQALLRWIVRNGRREFSHRDVGVNFDRFKDDEATLIDALNWMVARNLIRPRPDASREARRPGRRPSPRYQTNPALWTSPRFRQFLQNPLAGEDLDGIDGNEGMLEVES